MSISEKLQTIADNQQAIYNAGYVAGQVSEGVSVADQSYNPLSILAQSGKAVAEAIAPLEKQLPFVPSYKKLYDTVTITQEDIEAAGEEGITCITIGSDNVDLTPYNDILIKLHVPKSNTMNTADIGLKVRATTYVNESLAPDGTLLLNAGTASSTPTALLQYNHRNNYVIHTMWAGDTFLYGEMMRNYLASLGYPTRVEGWSFISEYFSKSSKKYFHLYGDLNKFKFPVGTYIDVYAR